EIIDLMNKDTSFNSGSMFPRYERIGSTLFNTKRPCRAKEYEAAASRYERQLNYCYCPFVRATKEKIAPVYCSCGAAFNKFIWEEIVEGEVKTEVVESVMAGGETCRFAIILPEA
ncbi:MAG: hypothetical protein KJ831_11295, partial [Candidatus Eisenbacteria bacterium]|nr:hypothetical protein [Candidatus Eisenbacteria bacterium]